MRSGMRPDTRAEWPLVPQHCPRMRRPAQACIVTHHPACEPSDRASGKKNPPFEVTSKVTTLGDHHLALSRMTG
jgi:hypothetical protein